MGSIFPSHLNLREILTVAYCCVYAIQLPIPFEFEGNPYDEVKIMVWDDGSRFRRSADDAIIPAQNLEASFSVKQHPVNLRLSRNDDLTPEVPVYTANEDGIIKEDIKDDHKAFFYQDVSNGAAVFVQTSQSSYCLFGTFIMENDEYFLEPNQRECTDLLVNSTFRVWRSNFSEIQNIDNIDRDIVDDYEPITRKENGRFKRNVADLKIETLFITDYSIYSYWYHKVTVKKESDRPRTTRSVIRQYYAFVINGMDVRFKNIPPKSSGFTISVVFSGIFIADTEAKSPFTEHHKVTSVTPNQVDASTVLNHTATWLQQQTGLPGFDHAMMFSRYDFAKGSSSGIVGKAFVGTMCTPKSVSIVEDRFSFIILEIAVHELGHSLNASHDGNGNQCSHGQYIMSRFHREVEKQPKPWNFSTCSIQYFGDLIASLDDQGLNCMADLLDDFDPTALVPEINTLPGTVYDVDEHCRHIVGEGSSFCRHLYNKNNLTDLCLILYCYNTKSMKCVGYLGGDGLSCGNKKWCLSGVCTFSESAPTKNEECLFGDDPFTFRYGIRTIKCKGGNYTVQNSPDLCYYGDIRRRCCATCSSAYNGVLTTFYLSPLLIFYLLKQLWSF
ncbi:A disintegrin and metalloproteinase with thrombospondin motifs 10 isoform X1 [Magallana gigas]|uniref:A disintegrin and metalloproteinase with thrombospondin motifs 10 isoform X1 n=1 Tax=Magallana gigas TaxID=29159 RepID=UPI003342A067